MKFNKLLFGVFCSVLMLSMSANAQSVDVSDFLELTNELSNGNPVNVMSNITFSSSIAINGDAQIDDNNYVFDGGRRLGALGAVINEGVAGFVINSGNQLINDVDMQNFNTVNSGAAIYNKGGDVTINDSRFSDNYAFDPAQIISIDYGGAIYNFNGIVNINNSTFTNNHSGGGGALTNNDQMVINNSTFDSNMAEADFPLIATEGGAIANYGTLEIRSSVFKNNTATSHDTKGYGGALYNAFTGTTHIYNSTFENNVSDNNGGAIYNDLNLYVYAIDGNTTFTGNTAAGQSSAIYNTCLVDLKANNGEIILNDSIIGTNASELNIGDSGYDGTIVLNADMSNNLGTTTFKNGTIKIGDSMGVDATGHLNMFGSGMVVNTISGGKSVFDMQNGQTDKYLADSKLTLNTDLYANIDVDLVNQEADKFVDLGTAGGSGNVIIENINIMEAVNVSGMVIEVADNNGGRISLDSSLKVIETPLYKYTVDDINLATNGTLVFDGGLTNGFNPTVFSSSSAKHAHASLMVDVNKHVLTPNQMTAPIGLASGDNPSKTESLWFDINGSSEDIKLDGITVENDSYIAIAGIDIKGQDNMTYSVYGGYVGSRQKYDSVDIKQNGFVVGGGARYDYDEFYTGLTANFITSFARGENNFGKEDFNMYAGSIGTKTGMDIKFMDNYSFEPNVVMSYHYIHTTDYTNASGLNIESDDLHIFHIAPELKFAAHMNNGFSPYVAASYNWNINSGGDVKANETLVPNIAVDNYAAFKLGFGKTHNNLDTYAEVIGTTGDRKGVGGHIGLKLNF